MAVPVKFPAANCVFKGDGCLDLPALNDGQSITACIELDAKERAHVFSTGKIFVRVVGQRWAPILLFCDPDAE